LSTLFTCSTKARLLILHTERERDREGLFCHLLHRGYVAIEARDLLFEGLGALLSTLSELRLVCSLLLRLLLAETLKNQRTSLKYMCQLG
jgi:hypothetical protein